MKRNTTYTRLRLAEYHYIEAEKRAKIQPVFTMSHRKKEANEVGCLGEVIAEDWMSRFGINYVPELEKTTHDYRIIAGDKNITIDVKTKDRTVVPQINYDNSAPCYNHNHQKPDYFFFISLHRDKKSKDMSLRRFHTAYILGGISYNELDNIGIRFLRGEKDWRNGTKFWTDCLNIEMWQLVPLSEIIKIFKGELVEPTIKSGVNVQIIKEMMSRIDKGELLPRKLPEI